MAGLCGISLNTQITHVSNIRQIYDVKINTHVAGKEVANLKKLDQISVRNEGLLVCVLGKNCKTSSTVNYLVPTKTNFDKTTSKERKLAGPNEGIIITIYLL